MDHQVVIAGIVIPSNHPLFLAIVAVHVIVALACAMAGVIAMLSSKGRGRHSNWGSRYYWLLFAVFLSASALSAMRWSEDYHLFVLGVLAFASASIGRLAPRQRWRHRMKLHIGGMGTSYVFLLIAFYVDNGPNLPLWRELPHFLYWLLPTVVGVLLIGWALLRHPLAQRT